MSSEINIKTGLKRNQEKIGRLRIQCKTFFLLISGGGVNVVGTSERYGSAAEHVERFTMVDAKGRILLVMQIFFIFSKFYKFYKSQEHMVSFQLFFASSYDCTMKISYFCKYFDQ